MPSANHFLTLGHSPDLSLLELKSLGLTVKLISDQIVTTNHPDILPIAAKLAGITRVIRQIQPTTKETLLADLTQLVQESGVKNHVISNYSQLSVTPHDLYELRTRVKISRPVRFLSFDTSGHSLVALRKQHVAEFSIIQLESELVIGHTVWIQNADDWAKRDRNRPYQDITRGMLPPKIARVMVNLATKGKQGRLLDPFCGTGTILMEGQLMGNEVIGTDNNPRAVTGSNSNLDWLASITKNPNSKHQVLLSDATHVHKHLSEIDFIATEPYLGPLISPKLIPSHQKLINIARGLDKLYRGALRSWSKILVKGGRVALVIPEFHAHHTVIPTLRIDTIASLGYNYLDSVAYNKPGAIVVRNITILEKQK